MIETPDDRPDYPGEALRSQAGAIGSMPRPIAPGEPCPILFRDVGPDALAAFLLGGIDSLAGPEAAVVWLRSAEVPPPTRATAEFGEIILLRPMSLLPWKVDEPGVYVAAADRAAAAESLGFVPPDLDRRAAAKAAEAMATEAEWGHHLGSEAYDGAKRLAAGRLGEYLAERSLIEEWAAPLRRLFAEVPERARSEMERLGLREEDLFGPWFGLDRERREEVRKILMGLGGSS
ncbi:MAG: hypothetical protein HYY93_13520 [Planctomycetes bacterium]|nr:hypothetical protein [Planctomycetota bacterium]